MVGFFELFGRFDYIDVMRHLDIIPRPHLNASSFNEFSSVLLSMLATFAMAQPPQGGGGGGATPSGASTYSGSTSITPGTAYVTANSVSNCATTASTAWTLPNPSTSYYAFYGLTSASSDVVTTSKTYSPSTSYPTGVYTVTFVTNQCPPTGKYNQYNGTASGYYATPNNYFISLPATGYSVSSLSAGSAMMSPVNGNTGYTLYGVNIYDPTDGGFWYGKGGLNPCTSGTGFCYPGTDLSTCAYYAEKQCGTSGLNTLAFMDDCGAHASPYHYHTSLRCEYPTGTLYSNSSGGHSALLGLALDGRGIYGQWESAGTLPSNLDPCGGHMGTTPTTTISAGTSGSSQSVTFNGGSSVYHYHVVDPGSSGFATGPTLVNCYGTDGTTTTATARALYTPTSVSINCGTSGNYSQYCTPYVGTAGCNGTALSFCTSKGWVNNYYLYCPIFGQQATSASPAVTSLSTEITYTSNASCTAVSDLQIFCLQLSVTFLSRAVHRKLQQLLLLPIALSSSSLPFALSSYSLPPPISLASLSITPAIHYPAS